MNKSKFRAGVLIVLSLLLISFFSCEPTPHFLNLQVQSPYTEASVTIPYSFRSEKAIQPCRILLKRLDGAMDIIADYEADLPQDGFLEFDFNALASERPSGYFRLTVTVLSAEGIQHQPISYLSQSRDFKIELAG